jgi:hypothetical protein
MPHGNTVDGQEIIQAEHQSYSDVPLLSRSILSTTQ